MKKLPIGIQTFSKLIEDNYVYVDKTQQIHKLVNEGIYYFLSRPRRFGKSLLCTTLKALFEGRQELFNDLWIGKNSDTNWKQYPIIHIDFNLIDHETPERLNDGLIRALQEIASLYQVILPESTVPGNLLQDLTNLLFKKYENKVVILIDEYDKAILRHVSNVPLATSMREILKSFYEPIKGLDAKLRFVFITGVSRFSKTSIFSGLNNLEDLTMSFYGSTLLGYTKDEIKQSFPEYINQTAEKFNLSHNQLIDQMRTWYNGYCFFIDEETKAHTYVYNPFSILSFFKNQRFLNYWFATGTPTFLINLIKEKGYPIEELEQCKASGATFESFDVDNIVLETLLFQTGYLTIRDYDKDSENYTLTYPNKETSDSLLRYIFKSMTGTSETNLNTVVAKLKVLFQKNDLQDLKTLLTSFYASIPYDIHLSDEKYYQTIFYVAFKLLSTNILVEQSTNVGRIDAIVQTPKICFIIEFKTKKTVQEAIEQIEDKKYYQPYMLSDKKIMFVGVKFNVELKNVETVEWKEWQKIGN